MFRHAHTWIERRTIVLVLIIVLIASGTPNVVSHVSAREAALDRALAVALDPRLAPDTGYQSTGTPPSDDEIQLLSGSITPSGANPQYPANHTFDAAPQTVGTPPTNHDFEVPGYAVGTPPVNYDLQAPTQSVSTPPTNHDFATGDLTGWTTTGIVTIDTDADHGSFAKLGASGSSPRQPSPSIQPCRCSKWRLDGSIKRGQALGRSTLSRAVASPPRRCWERADEDGLAESDFELHLRRGRESSD